jgi:ketosteroid isomerase-like protein
MSQGNVETVRRGIDAFNRRDFDAALALLRDDVTWERFLSRAEADTPVVRGKAELRSVWESQVDAVDIRAEADEFIPVGDDKVVVPLRMVAHGRSSDISLTASVVWVWTFDDEGLGVSVEAFDGREEALRAAGRRRAGAADKPTG